MKLYCWESRKSISEFWDTLEEATYPDVSNYSSLKYSPPLLKLMIRDPTSFRLRLLRRGKLKRNPAGRFLYAGVEPTQYGCKITANIKFDSLFWGCIILGCGIPLFVIFSVLLYLFFTHPTDHTTINNVSIVLSFMTFFPILWTCGIFFTQTRKTELLEVISSVAGCNYKTVVQKIE